jgi:hypothetical protein
MLCSLFRSGRYAETSDSGVKTLDTSGDQASGNCKRTFKQRWLVMYPWIEFKPESNKMFCKLCQQARKKNVFAIGGASMYY